MRDHVGRLVQAALAAPVELAALRVPREAVRPEVALAEAPAVRSVRVAAVSAHLAGLVPEGSARPQRHPER